eukprot:TRINITY_DN3810_c0_g1_i1.p1 TRINITY_DN3810_c0_g1~~TRINITY_DN3810_c0_g1_i1.p1  ORF type:complete len:138 (+),score=5.35 TRINITY_DN3810_c0_g1_i1:55-414(+)
MGNELSHPHASRSEGAHSSPRKVTRRSNNVGYTRMAASSPRNSPRNSPRKRSTTQHQEAPTDPKLNEWSTKPLNPLSPITPTIRPPHASVNQVNPEQYCRVYKIKRGSQGNRYIDDNKL